MENFTDLELTKNASDTQNYEDEVQINYSKLGYEQLQGDLQAKDSIISDLKRKVAELYVECQTFRNNKTEMQNEIKNLNLEYNTLQKSKDWYENKLLLAQQNKNKLMQEVVVLQKNHMSLTNSLEKSHSENNLLRQQVAQLQNSLKLKDMDQFAEVKVQNYTNLVGNETQENGTISSSDVSQTIDPNFNFIISDLENQIKVMKNDQEEKEQLIIELKKEKSLLSQQLTKLRNSSNEKDLIIQNLMRQIKELSAQMNDFKVQISESEQIINDLQNEKSIINIALAGANDENLVVNELLKNLRLNLSHFVHNFKCMKESLLLKPSLTDKIVESNNKSNILQNFDTLNTQTNLDKQILNTSIDLVSNREKEEKIDLLTYHKENYQLEVPYLQNKNLVTNEITITTKENSIQCNLVPSFIIKLFKNYDYNKSNPRSVFESLENDNYESHNDLSLNSNIHSLIEELKNLSLKNDIQSSRVEKNDKFTEIDSSIYSNCIMENLHRCSPYYNDFNTHENNSSNEILNNLKTKVEGVIEIFNEKCSTGPTIKLIIPDPMNLEKSLYADFLQKTNDFNSLKHLNKLHQDFNILKEEVITLQNKVI